MTNLNMREPSQISRENGGLAALRGWAGSRIGLLTIAGAAIVAGLAFNWSWLVAAGAAANDSGQRKATVRDPSPINAE